MSTNTPMPVIPQSTLQLVAAAPHRLLFLIGASNVLLAMGWWTLWLIDSRWHVWQLAQPAVPAGWMHAIVMQYQVLPAFMFGFLLTVFPRWMNQPGLARKHYVPVGLGLVAGQLLTLAGLLGSAPLIKLGAAVTLAGWSIGVALLGRLAYKDGGRTWHAVSCLLALSFGVLGLLAYARYLQDPDARMMLMAVKLGSLGLLLPIYFTVCHRMIPFFAGMTLSGYQARSPMWTLAAFWPLVFAHLWLELRHGYAWLWVPDLGLGALGLWLLRLWWPRGTAMPPLLRVLFVGFAWLPVAFALYCAQSLWFAVTGEFLLGRAPAHALFIGFFGSLLVAMVTRVTQGHSGRPLVLGHVAAVAFIMVQLVAVIRVLAELQADSLLWHALAAMGWLLAFTPWVLRSSWIYLTPRADGKAG